MAVIRFKAPLFKHDATANTDAGILLTLPKTASEQLPSKGMTMVKGTLNDVLFGVALEPDGKGSHWFKVKESLLDAAKVDVGDTVSLAIEPTKEWPEPKVPKAFQQALDSNAKAKGVWNDITPMARWDWIRWIGAAKQADTRKRRIEVACSKLNAGKRRPCCFDRTECTLTDA